MTGEVTGENNHNKARRSVGSHFAGVREAVRSISEYKNVVSQQRVTHVVRLRPHYWSPPRSVVSR